MNIDLAEMYNTPGGEVLTEEREKLAQYELFAKLAADHNINLKDLDDNQVAELWDATFEGEKTAAEHCPKCHKADCVCPGAGEGEKTSAAEIEFATEKEWKEKCAEADYLGRVMAHSYVQELGEIGENMDKQAGGEGEEKEEKEEPELDDEGNPVDKEASAREAVASRISAAREAASKGYSAAKGKAEKGYSAAKGKAEAGLATAKGKAGRAKDRAEAHLESVGGKMQGAYNKRVGPDKYRSMSSKQRKMLGASPYAAGAAAAAGAGGAAAMHKKGEAETINDFAIELAVEKIAEAGWDPAECAERIGSVFTLGLFDEENTKIASASDVDGAIEIRSLELLEAAGYEVNWPE